MKTFIQSLPKLWYGQKLIYKYFYISQSEKNYHMSETTSLLKNEIIGDIIKFF